MSRPVTGYTNVAKHGDWMVSKRKRGVGSRTYKWGAYQFQNGHWMLQSSFETEEHARVYAAAQKIAAGAQ